MIAPAMRIAIMPARGGSLHYELRGAAGELRLKLGGFRIRQEG